MLIGPTRPALHPPGRRSRSAAGGRRRLAPDPRRPRPGSRRHVRDRARRGQRLVPGGQALGRRRRGRSHTPDVEVDLPRGATVVIEAGSADIEADGLAGDQRYRTASGDMTLRAVSGRVAVDAVSGDVDISATGEAAMTIKTVSGDVELRAGDPHRPRGDHDERRPPDRRPAGRPGPVRDRDGQRRYAARPGRRRPDRDGDAVGRPALQGRRPDRGRPWTPVAGRRCRRTAGQPPLAVRRPPGRPAARRRSLVPAARAVPTPRAASCLPRHPSARPEPMPASAAERRHRGRLRRRPVAHPALARARRDRRRRGRPATRGARRHRSARRARAGSRCDAGPTTTAGERRVDPAPRPPGSTRTHDRCLTTPSNASSGWSPRAG